MPTTNSNKKILDLKRWEFCTPAPFSSAAAVPIISSRHFKQQQLSITSTTTAWMYNPSEDGWIALPSPALATFSGGTCGAAAAFSTGATAATASLTAAGGTTTSIITNQVLARDLRGYSVQFVGGTNAGKVKTIASNTIGGSATITFEGAPEAVAFDATSQYRLLTPNFFVFGGGTLASGSFKRYDLATNTWVTLANTGLPSSFGTDARLVATPSWILDGIKSFATGTATSGGASTLNNLGKAWTSNQWSNCQIRITGGTGVGQIRTIASNTSTGITVSVAWTTQPDNTSTYSIEGNDDFLYLMGNNAVTMYRYSISGNTWTTLSPSVARAGAPGQGMGAAWVHSVSASDWTSENAIQNGRYIYSVRGGASTAIDRYDIALNTWAALTYAPATETFTTGTKYEYIGDRLYIHQNATGRWFAFDFTENAMLPWSTMLYSQSTAVIGDTAFGVTYRDGATEVNYIYMLLNSSSILLRQMVI